MDNELLSMGQQFSAKGDDESGTIKKGEPQVSKVVTEIKFPLLSMIPINSIQIAAITYNSLVIAAICYLVAGISDYFLLMTAIGVVTLHI